MARFNRSSRNGLVLLIVLGMLALFSLLVVTYVVFSTDSKNASLIVSRSDYHSQNPRTTTDELLKLIIRGKQTPSVTNEPPNSLYHHDLLWDLYGDPRRGNLWYGPDGSDPLVGSIVANSLEIRPNASLPPLGFILEISLPKAFPAHDTFSRQYLTMTGAFSGRILTIRSGPLRNRSFRIASHEYSAATERNYVTIFTEDSSVSLASLVNSEIMINDSIFDGSGAFGVARAPLLGAGGDQRDFFPSRSPKIHIALLPHHKMLMINEGDFQFWLRGEADESFDVADYNDMFLADRNNGEIIPSYHRPELINYIASRYSVGNGAISKDDLLDLLSMLESATLRPLSFDIRANGVAIKQRNPVWRQASVVENVANPSPRSPTLSLDIGSMQTISSVKDIEEIQKFLNFHISGPWDVDTDGDLVPDSVWIDPSLPMHTAPNGKLLKPMAAIQILALDGRLDLNAVGEMLQSEANYGIAPFPALATNNSRILSQGSGIGAAEVGVGHLFANSADFAKFFSVRYAPGRSVSNPIFLPGLENVNLSDPPSALRELEVRNLHSHAGLPGFARDTRGRQAFAIDRAGNIVSLNQSSQIYNGNIPSENENDPYENRVHMGGHGDSLFSLAELERVVRRYDTDHEMLPNRLEKVLTSSSTGVLAAGASVRDSITTRTSSINTVSPGFYYLPISPYSLTPYHDTLNHPVYIWLARYIEAQQKPGYVLDSSTFQALFPVEFRSGQKLDLNRLLGNGVDDNGNLSIDEPTEWFFNSTLFSQPIRGFDATLDYYLSGRYPYNSGSAPLLDRDVSLNGPVKFSGMETRQLLARELYCLLQAIVPYDYIFPDFPRPNANTYPSSSDAAVRAFRARKLAQWAINIIDFRDADSACTRFAYDIEPFNSSIWDLSIPSETGIVWGMEQPELLLTENVSFHDRRVRDTKIGSEGRVEQDEEKDDDMDQYRIPQGTSVFELFVPRTTGSPQSPVLAGASPSLYTVDGSGQVALNLNAFAPPDGTRPGQPVWRLAISKLQERGDQAKPNPDEVFRNPAIRGNYSYQPVSAAETAQNGLAFDASNPGNNRDSAELERVVYFSNAVPSEIPLNGNWVPSSRHAYWNRTAATTAKGGQYVVVAPRVKTFLGSVKGSAAVAINQPSAQSLEVSVANSLVRLTGVDGIPKTDTSTMPVKSIVPIIAAGETPSAMKQQWNDAFPDGIGVSISEPLPGDSYSMTYRVPTKKLNSDDNPGTGMGFGELPPDSYYDYADGSGGFPDEPFDVNNDALNISNGPLPNDDLRTRTELNVRTVYLQRLADPLRPYDPTFNPYITVDWMPMDLTIFNGEDDVDDKLATMNGDISRDPSDPAMAQAQRTNLLKFGSRVRRQGNALSHYYTYESFRAPNSVLAPGNMATPVYFPYEVSRTPAGGTESSLGFVNVLDVSKITNNPVAGYEGMLSEEFCSLAWFNRVYSNSLELSLVPMSGPGQLHQDFSPRGNLSQASKWYTDKDFYNNLPFGHLPPFYSTSHAGSGNSWVQGANLSTLMSFVDVGPPWADYWKTLDPSMLESAASNISNPEAQRALLSFRGPFSQIPSHRVAGKVNLNAISEETVWRGLEWNTLESGGRDSSGAVSLNFWQRFTSSRQGYAGYPAPSGGGVDPFGVSGSTVDWATRNWTRPNLDYNYPTRFAGAFKENPGQSGFVPLGHLKRNPVDVTPFRSDKVNGDVPLFLRDPSRSNFDQSKHSIAHYQDTTRLGSLTTSHSNVFAVWITLGYFEWSEKDGLLQEYKASSGENKRHRSFFLIDRSIPVGYRPGEDWNVEDTVLIRRYLD